MGTPNDNDGLNETSAKPTTSGLLAKLVCKHCGMPIYQSSNGNDQKPGWLHEYSGSLSGYYCDATSKTYAEPAVAAEAPLWVPPASCLLFMFDSPLLSIRQ